MGYLWYPAALLLGFVGQAFYMPSTASSPLAGCMRIILIALGASVAYWWRFR